MTRIGPAVAGPDGDVLAENIYRNGTSPRLPSPPPGALPEKVILRVRTMTGDQDIVERVANRLTRMQSEGVDEATLLHSVAALVNHPETIAPDGGIEDAGPPAGAFLDERHDEQREADDPDRADRDVDDATGIATAPDGLHLTDTANATRLVDAHGDAIRYVPVWGTWLAWDSRRWGTDHDAVRVTELAKSVPKSVLESVVKVTDSSERKRLVGFVNRSESAASLGAMVKLARTSPKVVIGHRDLDAEHMFLTLRNGELDLRERRLHRHDPARLSTKLADVVFDPDATAPEFDGFMKTIIPDEEVRDYLRRFAGYSMTGSVAEQMFGVWHGEGANGKSTLINVLRRLLGDYAVVAKRELLIASRHEQHPTALADLHGARLATCVELREGAVLDEARVKALTGGDTISARRMKQDFYDFEPTHKLVVATNHRPRIRADDPATWRRVHLVPFEVTIPTDKIDRDLGDRIIANEMPGVLNWAIAGLEDWQKQGLNPPQRVRGATDDYRLQADTVAAFMADEGLRYEPSTRTSSSSLQEAHERWSNDAGVAHHAHWQQVTARWKENGATNGKFGGIRCWQGISADSEAQK